ncbi:hypothetical protein TNCT_310271 [Trichonephila clavata]|uniref:Uncharacterized protein n=1 Tax=Trichonephila clavata TaxID=2740835 RepID=A0A8X6GKC2_TRICU|nr:hypothetical protein TNCT_310271 [Trichonephila clavata]
MKTFILPFAVSILCTSAYAMLGMEYGAGGGKLYGLYGPRALAMKKLISEKGIGFPFLYSPYLLKEKGLEIGKELAIDKELDFGKELALEKGIGYGKELAAEKGFGYGKELAAEKGFGYGKELAAEKGIGYGKDLSIDKGIGYGKLH